MVFSYESMMFSVCVCVSIKFKTHNYNFYHLLYINSVQLLLINIKLSPTIEQFMFYYISSYTVTKLKTLDLDQSVVYL